MTPNSITKALEIQDALCRQSFSAFLRRSFTIINPQAELCYNWHHDCISEYLGAVRAGEITRLIVNIPPRSLKSESISIAYPAWIMGNDPTKKIISCSYAKDLSLDHSVKCRDLVESEEYKRIFPIMRMKSDQNEKAYFKTTEQGHRFATSVGAKATGYGADLLVIDDPMSPLQAHSDIQRQEVNRWVSSTLFSRLNDKQNGAIVLVMQRLHEDDTTGYLLQRGDWHHLKLPAQAHSYISYSLHGKTWGMQDGDLLHEDREGKEVLTRLRQELGDYEFSGQYLQEPVPSGGGEFKEDWVQYWCGGPDGSLNCKGMNVYILVDPADSKATGSDFTSIIVVGLNTDNNYYILEMVRDKFNPTQRVNKIISLHRKWNGQCSTTPVVGVEKNNFLPDFQFMESAQEQHNYRFKVIKLSTRKGGGADQKNQRVRSLIPLLQTGRLYFPSSMEYTPLYTIENGKPECIDLTRYVIQQEMLPFPVARYDDMLDALSRITDEDMEMKFPAIDARPLDYSYLYS